MKGKIPMDTPSPIPPSQPSRDETQEIQSFVSSRTRVLVVNLGIMSLGTMRRRGTRYPDGRENGSTCPPLTTEFVPYEWTRVYVCTFVHVNMCTQ